MTEKSENTKASWIDPDEPPEWPDEVWDRAEIAVGGVVIRPATGTLTKRGRPPVGDAPKQQVTLRLPRHVLEHFKAGGAGWQTRIGEVLARHAEADADAGGVGASSPRSARVGEMRGAYRGKSTGAAPKK
jgi:BrnA antitoxin of type II toxin-antitoxin system